MLELTDTQLVMDADSVPGLYTSLLPVIKELAKPGSKQGPYYDQLHKYFLENHTKLKEVVDRIGEKLS